MRTVSHDKVSQHQVSDGFQVMELATGNRSSVLHFRIKPGVTVPHHCHEHEQLGYLLTGELTFILEDGEEVLVEADDSYAIESNDGHAAVNCGETVATGIDIFSPPRTKPDWESWQPSTDK